MASHPYWRVCSVGWMDTPPWIGRTVRGRLALAAREVRVVVVWRVSSRVGDRIRRDAVRWVRGFSGSKSAGRESDMDWRRGRVKAAVLPVPVGAVIWTSSRATMEGIDEDWTGVGDG